MNVKAKVKIIETVEIQIGDEKYSGFKETGEMAGMIEFKNDQGTIVLDCQGEFPKIVRKFSSLKNDPECHVVKLSPCFFPKP